MRMSKKHFKDLAAALHSCQLEAHTPEARELWGCAVRAIATVCSAHNRGFDWDRFIRACNGETDRVKT